MLRDYIQKRFEKYINKLFKKWKLIMRPKFYWPFIKLK